MVTILKDIPVQGIEVIPCRLNGPRGIVKAFVLHDEQSLIVVDTGFSDEDAERIVERIEQIGRKLADVDMCILTHYHGDHIGGLRKLRSLADFAVVSHEQDVAAIEKATGVKVDRTVADGDALPELGGIQVFHVPGHSPGSIVLYVPAAKALLAGDTILSAGEHLVVSPPYLCFDYEQAQASVKRLLDMGLDIQHLLVCHGDDVYNTASQPLARIFTERRAQP